MDSSNAAQAENKTNILIVDQEGFFGSALAEQLSDHAVTVFVSRKIPPNDSSVIHIPFHHTIPSIPDGVYASTVYVFSPHTKDLLEPLMQKSAMDKGNFFIVVPYQLLPLAREVLQEKKTQGHLVVLGDVFGGENSEIDEWLTEVKKTKKIALPRMGLRAWRPVLFADAVDAICRLCLISHTEKKTYLIAPNHSITQLTLAHGLQKIDPLLRIDFAKDDKESGNTFPDGTYVLKEYAALAKIQKEYKDKIIQEETDKPARALSQPPSNRKSKKKKGAAVWFVLYSLAVFISMPALLMVFSALLARMLLFSSVDDLKQGKFSSALRKVEAAQINISFSQFSVSLTKRELSVIGQSDKLNSIAQQLLLASLAVETVTEGVTGAQKLQNVLSGTSLKPTDDIRDGTNELRNSLVLLQKLQTYPIPKFYEQSRLLLNANYPLLETIINGLPQLVGTDGDREYLVLFQNNTELRPGGGFIGSYGLLKLSHGKFKSFTIHDVYDADGQLKGHVEPPFAIRRYIPLEHLYLRDSNFDIDFLESAKQASLMLNAETGERVDGVIGVDLSFVKNLLSALGDVYVPGYNQNVTADNFFLLTEQHAEKNFFPGSSQKKDFLSALFSALQEKITSANKTAYEKIAEGVFKSVREKHLLFAFSGEDVEAPFGVNGFSSTIIDDRPLTNAAINDYLGISEANVGGNKVNYYVRRSVTQKVYVSSQGIVRESLQLTLQNTSTGKWPGGDYKNYLRFILPKGTTLDTVVINNEVQKTIPAITEPNVYESILFSPPAGLEVNKTEEHGKTVFGFLVSTPSQKTTTITLSYTLPGVVALSQSLPKYSLQIFKQPGVDDIPYLLQVSFPQVFSLLTSSETVESKKQTITMKKDVLQDSLFEATFARQ